MHARRDLENLYMTHGASVYRRALQLLGNPHDAEEAVQDVFAKVIESIDDFRGDSHVMSWLYRTTTNLCLNRLRNARRRTELVAQHLATAHAGQVPAQADRLSILRELLARMPEELASAAACYYVDEMTQSEIAQVLNCSRRHVGDLLERARAWAAKEVAA